MYAEHGAIFGLLCPIHQPTAVIVNVTNIIAPSTNIIVLEYSVAIATDGKEWWDRVLVELYIYVAFVILMLFLVAPAVVVVVVPLFK